MTGLNNELIQQVGKQLIRQQQSTAVAESVTGGMLQFAICGVVNAVKFYQGGVTAYNISHKCRLPGVEPHHAMAVNCVSAEVAKTMAKNVAKLFNSDWGIAITGYATPVPESQQQIFVFFSISFREKLMEEGKLVPQENTPAEIQTAYVNGVLRNLAITLRA